MTNITETAWKTEKVKQKSVIHCQYVTFPDQNADTKQTIGLLPEVEI